MKVDSITYMSLRISYIVTCKHIDKLAANRQVTYHHLEESIQELHW